MKSNNITTQLKVAISNNTIDGLTAILDKHCHHEDFFSDRQINELFECARQSKNTKAMAMILDSVCYWLSEDFDREAEERDEQIQSKLQGIFDPNDYALEDESGKTLLYWGVKNNQIKMFKALIKIMKSAPIEQYQNQLITAWNFASMWGCEEICVFLMPYLDFKCMKKHGARAFNLAVQSNHEEVAKRILHYRFYVMKNMNFAARWQLVNDFDECREHIILMAYQCKEYDFVRTWVNKINITGMENGSYFLHEMLAQKNLKVAKWLLKHANYWDFDDQDQTIYQDLFLQDSDVLIDVLINGPRSFAMGFKKYLSGLDPLQFVMEDLTCSNFQLFMKNWISSGVVSKIWGKYELRHYQLDVFLPKLITTVLHEQKYEFLKQIMQKTDSQFPFRHYKFGRIIYEIIQKYVDTEYELQDNFIKFFSWACSNNFLAGMNITRRLQNNLPLMLDELQKNKVNIKINRTIEVPDIIESGFYDKVAELYLNNFIDQKQKFSIFIRDGYNGPSSEPDAKWVMSLLMMACFQQQKNLLKQVIEPLRFIPDLHNYIIVASGRALDAGLDIVKILVEKSKEVFDQNNPQKNYGLNALYSGQNAIMKSFTPTHTRFFPLFRVTNEQTALTVACSQGNKRVVHYLISQGVDINCIPRGKSVFFSPLSCAIKSKEPTKWDVVNLLLDNGAALYTKSYTASQFKTAITHSNKQMLNLLLKHPHSSSKLLSTSMEFKSELIEHILKGLSKKRESFANIKDVLQLLISKGINKFLLQKKMTNTLAKFAYFFGSEDRLFGLIRDGFEMFYNDINLNTDASVLLAAELNQAKSQRLKHEEQLALAAKRKFLGELNQVNLSQDDPKTKKMVRGFISEELKNTDKHQRENKIHQSMQLLARRSQNVNKAVYMREWYIKLIENGDAIENEKIKNGITEGVFDPRFLTSAMRYQL